MFYHGLTSAMSGHRVKKQMRYDRVLFWWESGRERMVDILILLLVSVLSFTPISLVKAHILTDPDFNRAVMEDNLPL